MKSDTKFLTDLTDREIRDVMRDELVKTNQGLVALDLELEHRLDEQQNIIHILQEELTETNRGLMALSLELEQRVEKRTAELSSAQSELQRINSDLLLLTMELDVRVAQRTEELTKANAALSQEIAERRKAEAALRESEIRIRAKLDSLLTPEGDIGVLDLADIMDIPKLQTLMDDFFKLTGIGMAILNLKGQVLVAIGWQDICVQFHRVHPVTCQNCIESDILLSQGVKPGVFKLYRCKNQMYDIATPITVSGQHLGNLFLGQFFFDDEPPDREAFRAQAQRYGFDEALYLAALDRTPRWSRDTVQTVMTFYARFTDMFSTLSYSNIQLARSMAEQQRVAAALRESEDRYHSLFANSMDAVLLTTPTGGILAANPEAQRLLGYSEAELQRIGRQGIVDTTDPRLAAMLAQRARDGRFRGELTFITQKGRKFPAEISSLVFTRQDGQQMTSMVFRDITERQRTEAALKHSEAQYRAIIETSPDGFWITDYQGRLLEANEAYARLSGYRLEELRTLTVAELEASENPHEMAAHRDKVVRDGSDLFQTLHRAKSGRVWQAEISSAYWPIAGGRIFSFIRDINRRQRAEALLKVRLHLSEMATRESLDPLLRAALDIAERFTGSTISFFHFVDPDQEHVFLQSWSTLTLKNHCSAIGKGQHYPISQAGVWADGIRQHRPVIHNDYAGLPDKKGLPEGHAVLIRELVVPILRNPNQAVALLGVGNKPEDYDEDDLEVVKQLAAMVMEVVERKWTEERMAHLAYHDALTELPNRLLLTDRLQQAMDRALRDQQRLAVCYLDLDDFKPINDAWGHAQGDRTLIDIAERLKQWMRAGDTVARLGGDEFALLITELSDLEECERALDRILGALQAPFSVSGESTRLTASLGVTLYPDDRSDPDVLLRHADQAMYVAKQAGGNRYQLFDPDYDRRARSYREIRKRAQDGLAAGEFRLYYQPKVDLRQGVVIGAEALIRWQHPDEGLLPPARFMPAVDAGELSVAVGQWVLNEALRQMAVWMSQGLPLPVSVNLSGRHLQHPEFVTRLQALLAAYPTVPADRLELEILETAALEDLTATSRLIDECRKLGVRFALDDFGTGYSSLTYLKHLPVHLLKIDQSFVRDMLTDSEALAIVRGVIGLALAFHRDVIAEGVETAEHSCELLRLGCNLVQGHGIARPMPPEQIPGWVAGWTPPPVGRA